VLRNQYYKSTGVAPSSGVWPPGDSYHYSGLWKRVAPGGEGDPARRCLQRQWASRRVARGGTCSPPGGLVVRFAWRLKSSARQFS